jgi:hypothetical protein
MHQREQTRFVEVRRGYEFSLLFGAQILLRDETWMYAVCANALSNWLAQPNRQQQPAFARSASAGHPSPAIESEIGIPNGKR